MFYNELMNYDAEVYASCKKEFDRQQFNIELIASENVVSKAVLLAAGTPLTNKYAEGYPAKRYYGGCQFVDEVEEIARERAKKLFGAEHANVQPHCGASANLAVFFALLNPGDTVLSMSLAEGGHLSHGSPVNISGKYFNFVPYGVDDDGRIDYDALEALAKENQPKLIVAGASAYPAFSQTSSTESSRSSLISSAQITKRRLIYSPMVMSVINRKASARSRKSRP